MTPTDPQAARPGDPPDPPPDDRSDDVATAVEPQSPVELPAATRRIALDDGRELFLVGTAHVSKKSVDDVRATIEAVEPDTVAVELCASRHQNIVDRESWRKLDIFKVLREGKAPLLLSSLVMTAFQRRIAKELGVVPGAEMIEGMRAAEEQGARLVLADRDIQTTLRRTWARLGWWTRLKMMGQLLGGLFSGAEIDAETVEKLKEDDQLHDMLDAMAHAFPQVKSTLIDERDVYLAEKIRRAGGERIVAVVGAGHVPGIRDALSEEHDLGPLEAVPPRGLAGRVLKWLIPAVIVALLVVGFLRGGLEESAGSVLVWFLVNGILSAVGAAVALGHPITVVSAFFAAPLTSLNPLIAAGWVAGLVQAWVKRPTVKDLEDLPEDITTLKGFWRNPVCRILLVVVLANLGSTLGTFIAGSWIATRVF